MAAAQALDFRTHKLGYGVNVSKKIIRNHVDFLDEDRPLYKDHDTMKAIVKRCDISRQIEDVLGSIYEN